MSDQEQELKQAERAARERYERTIAELRDGTYRFASKIRGQAGLVVEELIDPEGEAVTRLAEIEGDTGALALATPIEMILFETWLLGQIGDEEELDLKNDSHWQTWFNFGAWIGETLRRRHGGYWLPMSEDPKTWRMGFSKILLEIAPFAFAEQLLRMGSGSAFRLISEIERVRQLHEEQKERDGGNEIERFTATHYVRMHTVPLGQWMVLEMALVDRLWNQSAVRDLIKELRKLGKNLPPPNQPLVERLVAALEKADQEKPVGQQTTDRGLFEAIAQIVGLRRASAPIAIDILQHIVLPAMHVGIPEQFPPLDDDDIAHLRQGLEFFAFYIEVVPHKYPADDNGLLGVIPHSELATPYRDRNNLEIGKGDWVVVNPRRFREMLGDFDGKRLLDKYDEFVAYVRADTRAPRRRDDGRMLADTVARALIDLKACVAMASQAGHALLFRMLPPAP